MSSRKVELEELYCSSVFSKLFSDQGEIICTLCTRHTMHSPSFMKAPLLLTGNLVWKTQISIKLSDLAKRSIKTSSVGHAKSAATHLASHATHAPRSSSVAVLLV